MFIKYKHLSAKWGKQWGKHYPHLATFLCTCLHHQNAETVDSNAFKGIGEKDEVIKLDSGRPYESTFMDKQKVANIGEGTQEQRLLHQLSYYRRYVETAGIQPSGQP